MAFDWSKLLTGGGKDIMELLFPNPANNATKTLDQIPGTIKPYYDPYINAGGKATGAASDEFGKMLSDPNSIIERLSAGYKPSAGYQWKLNQGTNAINNAQAAGGMVGTKQNQQESGEFAEHLADQDFQNYLNSVLGVYNQGAAGTLDLSHQGLNASSDLATSLGNYLSGKAGMDYAGQANQNDMLSGLIKSLITAAGSGGVG